MKHTVTSVGLCASVAMRMLPVSLGCPPPSGKMTVSCRITCHLSPLSSVKGVHLIQQVMHPDNYKHSDHVGPLRRGVLQYCRLLEYLSFDLSQLWLPLTSQQACDSHCVPRSPRKPQSHAHRAGEMDCASGDCQRGLDHACMPAEPGISGIRTIRSAAKSAAVEL